MLASDEVRIAVHEALPPDDEIERAGDAYLAGFGGPPYFETPDDRARFIDRVRRYAARDGFRLAVAGAGEVPVGVGLAVIGRPGDWWRDRVAEHLAADEVERWLGAGVLELVHLAVRVEDRGRGIGAAIHDALLSRPAVRTAALSADTRPTPARRLYERRGWQILRPSLRIAGGDPVVLMVRDLESPTEEVSSPT